LKNFENTYTANSITIKMNIFTHPTPHLAWRNYMVGIGFGRESLPPA
jgi:hypothetical protein